MKLNSIKYGFILALAGCMMSACQSDPVPSGSEGSVTKLTLNATLPEAEGTKTALGAGEAPDTFDILWKSGDKISVNGFKSNAVAAADDGKKQVNFTVEGTLTAPFRVLYPGTTSTNVISLPATQNYVADSFDPSAAAAYGTATKSGNKYGAKLNNFCGYIRFALKGSATLSKIELNSLGSENLYGNFTLATNDEGFSGTFTGGTSGTLNYSFGSGLTLTGSDTYIYIALPAQAYASGIEALVYQTDGAFMRLKFWGSGWTLLGTKIIGFESKTYAAGRTENLFGIDGLDVEEGGEPTAVPGITVAIFNTCRFEDDQRPAAAVVADNDKAENRPANAIIPSCTEMRAAFGKVIYNTAADIIGFNEVGDDMYASGQANSVQDLATAAGCTGYTFKFYASNESGDHHFDNGFAYKSSVLTLNDSGRMWLYKEDTSPWYSTSDDSRSGSPKTNCVWAKFTHKVSGRVFWLFVTQLPTVSHGGNIYASKGMNAWAQKEAGSGARQILVGDTNSCPGHESEAGYNELKNYWTDVYEYLGSIGALNPFYQTYSGTQSGTGKNYQYPILTFCKNHPERRIDHIMTRNCSATSYKTIRNTYSFGEGDAEIQCYPSDHLAIVSYITLD